MIERFLIGLALHEKRTIALQMLASPFDLASLNFSSHLPNDLPLTDQLQCPMANGRRNAKALVPSQGPTENPRTTSHKVTETRNDDMSNLACPHTMALHVQNGMTGVFACPQHSIL